ncbi:MAG TPA: hypothetical protein VD816_17980 [Ohtaekwangia sp.]|nr:hypothetical protein [Ohtaekwangia sp.]
MKSILVHLAFSALVLCYGCGQKSDQHAGHDHASDPLAPAGNAALDSEIMKIHDEVMPRMDEIYRLKQGLKTKVADSTNIPTEQKQEIEATIAKLDSASEGMMVWMRQYKPVPDSVAGEEKAREYLENQMEKVRKVREDMLEAIEKAKAINP